ncbi:MAG: hypothetical protein EHM48_00665 [Planctomycetaceae bacterium]|nr:MAG: hypothetical protein EHM48_00665 [Planctomycetaceae bacterium]
MRIEKKKKKKQKKQQRRTASQLQVLPLSLLVACRSALLLCLFSSHSAIAKSEIRMAGNFPRHNYDVRNKCRLLAFMRLRYYKSKAESACVDSLGKGEIQKLLSWTPILDRIARISGEKICNPKCKM